MAATGGRRAPDVPALVAGIQKGHRASVSRAITLVESSRPDHRLAARELLAELNQPVAEGGASR